jgi:uncharacterized protein (UPF0218 family)
MYKLKNETRAKLKNPLGKLLTGSQKTVINDFLRYIKNNNPSKIYAVGDVTTKNLIENGIKADIYIVDNKVMREKVPETHIKTPHEIHVQNPPGSITREAWKAIKFAIKKDEVTKIVVEGEEDLLTLPMIVHSPEDAIVVYGQPNEGLVIVHITEKKKIEVKNLLKEMAIEKDPEK